MDIERAREILGVSPNAEPKALEEALVIKRGELTDRLQGAPTEALKKKYTDSLADLTQAFNLLNDLLKPKDFHVPEIPGLSKSAVMDLPGAIPFYTQSDQQGGNVGASILKPGDVLMDRYEVRRLIGSGGMGAVYAAYDRNTDQEIAIKVLLPALMKDDRSRERFFTEGRISRQLSHASILNVYDINKNADLYFISMDLLQGRTLRGEINARKARGANFSVEEVLNLAHTICDALSYAHEFTIHRDIKPENIFITSDEKIKLMDFGLARIQSQSQLTRTGVAMGTAYYMAPEQLEGAKDIDGRADQYSLAVVLYELFTGSVPVGRVKSVYLRRPDVPREISDALDKALDGDPKERFPNMKSFSDALRMVKKAPPPVREVATKPVIKNPSSSSKPLALGGIAIVLVSAVSYGLFFRSGSEIETSSAKEKSEPKVEAKKEEKPIVPTSLPTRLPTKAEERGVISMSKPGSLAETNPVLSKPPLEKMANASILEKLNKSKDTFPDIDNDVGQGEASVTIRKSAEIVSTKTQGLTTIPPKTEETMKNIENPEVKIPTPPILVKTEPTLSQVASIKIENLPANKKEELLPQVPTKVPEIKPTIFEMDSGLKKLRSDAVFSFGEWKKMSQGTAEANNPMAKLGEKEFSKGEDAVRSGDRQVVIASFQRAKEIFDGLIVSLKTEKPSPPPVVKPQVPRPAKNILRKPPPTRRPLVLEPPSRIPPPENNDRPAPRRRRAEPVD